MAGLMYWDPDKDYSRKPTPEEKDEMGCSMVAVRPVLEVLDRAGITGAGKVLGSLYATAQSPTARAMRAAAVAEIAAAKARDSIAGPQIANDGLCL